MICVDASLAAKWILPEELSDRARALARHWAETRERLLAPGLLPIEITNILRRRVVDGELDSPEAHLLLQHFLAFPIGLRASDALHEQALALADEYDLPAAYDAYYLAVASQEGAELWTADQRLLNRLAGRLPFVHFLTDYEPDPSA